MLVGDGLEVIADFSRFLPRLKHHNLSSELLVKAAKIKKADHSLTLVDATAGLGEDSLLLAAAGFHVTLFEKDPVIFALLDDAIHRAQADPQLSEIARRMTAKQADSIAELKNLSLTPDVVLLDPMFPGRTKSAEVKKKFQLIHRLEHPCENEAELLEAALAAHPAKIVIKRPLKGPCLAGVKPAYSLDGKAIRYDVIIPG